MDNYLDLFMFFAIYSFLGWILETIFASLNERKFVNRGFLTGAFCPIYGFGAVMIIESSNLFNNVFEDYFTSLFGSILFSIFTVTALEYITGILLEKIFNYRWWDYSNNALNIKGYICIKYSLLWGLLAFMLVQVVHPVIYQTVFSIHILIKDYVVVFLLVYFMLDTVKSVISALDLRKVILNYSNIPVNNYYEKILKYKRFFLAFPRLLLLNAGIVNRDIRSILNDRMDKIKAEIKNRFQQL